MDGLAIVPQRLLGESFRVAAHFGPFGPRVTVAVQRDDFSAQLAATLAKLRGPVSGPHLRQVGGDRAFRREVFEQPSSDGVAKLVSVLVSDADKLHPMHLPLKRLELEGKGGFVYAPFRGLDGSF